MKILIFTEGTILMQKSSVGCQREEIVRQVINENPSVRDCAHYVPVKNAAGKIRGWADQCATIIYMTSRRKTEEIRDIQNVLERNKFPKGALEYRRENEDYKDVAERIMPDVLIEDDCESIGGEPEMTHPHIRKDIKEKIKSVVVKEFGGIDHLPEDVNVLARVKSNFCHQI